MGNSGRLSARAGRGLSVALGPAAASEGEGPVEGVHKQQPGLAAGGRSLALDTAIGVLLPVTWIFKRTGGREEALQRAPEAHSAAWFARLDASATIEDAWGALGGR